MGTPTDSQSGAARTTSARGPLGGLAAATSLFTILPAPMIADVDRRVATRAIRAFPWLGLCLGVVGGLIAGGVLAMGAGSWLAAILALVWLTGATGGFHLDGVADTADGLGSRRDPARALEIMKQSDIGPMGVIALVLTLLVDLGALSSLTGTAGALGAGSWWRVGLLV
ncbi:MAG: adenosylcobinamide-GDP ribazoletransferase, partial [Stenotrophomonas maltophilia]